MLNISPVVNFAIKPTKIRGLYLQTLNNSTKKSNPIVNFAKSHKKATSTAAAIVVALGAILGGGKIYAKIEEEKRLSTIEADTFSTTKDINGKSYKVFGNTKELDGFMKGIEENKDKLMDVLNISEAEYEEFTQIALALADTETDSGNLLKAPFYLREPFRIINNLLPLTTKNPASSSGLTNIKVADSYARYAKFGIKSGADIHDNPYKSGIATIIKINRFKNLYNNRYLKRLEKEFPNLPEERKLPFQDYCLVVWKGGSCIEKGSTQKEATATVNSIIKIKNGGKPTNDFEREYKAWRTRLDQCK